MSPPEPAAPLPARPFTHPDPASTRVSCGGPSRKRRSRALAAALLLALALRLALGPVPLASLGAGAAALALGACLWWVAQRQTSHSAALLALSLYAEASPALSAPSAFSLAGPAPALGLFAMVYTATGVAHALQGPRRKWPPRIGLMAAATLFTAAASSPACAAGLLLSLPCALWLAERRRPILLLCFLFWTLLALSPALLLAYPLPPIEAIGGGHTGSLLRLANPFQPGLPTRIPSIATHAPFLLLALSAALAFYAWRPRSRFYGNTVPLLLTLALLPLSRALALPFALLFLAGIAADAFESPAAKPWRFFFWTLAALQLGWLFRT